MTVLDQRVWSAQGDAWQAEGRLREPLGGGAAELPGIRLMASGLPHAQWNNGDVTDPGRVDIEAVRAWYAGRAHGTGVPWGVRVPAGMPFGHGRYLFRKRCMGLVCSHFIPAAPVAGLRIRRATPSDAQAVAGIDASAFGGPMALTRPWGEPQLGAAGFTVALAEFDGDPVGIATAIVTDVRAGPAVGLFGVGVLDRARARGVGSAATSWLLERAFDRGADLAHLNPDTAAAARLYGRLGFTETRGLDVYIEL